jgi:hypothetical protein
MNNKFPKTFIKHYNTCFLTLKGLIINFKTFDNYIYIWNLLHKPWHNNIKKIIRIFEKKLKTF